MLFSVFGILLGVVTFMFLCDSPLANNDIVKQMEKMHKDMGLTQKYLLLFFGSAWNPLVWILPV